MGIIRKTWGHLKFEFNQLQRATLFNLILTRATLSNVLLTGAPNGVGGSLVEAWWAPITRSRVHLSKSSGTVTLSCHRVTGFRVHGHSIGVTVTGLTATRLEVVVASLKEREGD